MKDALEKAIGEMETLKGKMEAGEVDPGAAPKAIDEIINSLKALMSGDGETEDGEEEAEKAAAAAAKDGKEPDGDEAPAAVEAEAIKKEAAAVKTENEKLIERAEVAEQKIKLYESKELVNNMLRESHLPAGTYDDLKKILIGKDKNYIKEMIEARKNFLSSFLKAKVDGNGEIHIAESKGGKPAASIYDGMPMKK